MLPVSLSAKLATPVTVNFAVTATTASYSSSAGGGGDFGGRLGGTLSFPAGTLLRNVSLPIWPDLLIESDESFTVELSGLNGAGVTLVRATGTATIVAP